MIFCARGWVVSIFTQLIIFLNSPSRCSPRRPTCNAQRLPPAGNRRRTEATRWIHSLTLACSWMLVICYSHPCKGLCINCFVMLCTSFVTCLCINLFVYYGLMGFCFRCVKLLKYVEFVIFVFIYFCINPSDVDFITCAFCVDQTI